MIVEFNKFLDSSTSNHNKIILRSVVESGFSEKTSCLALLIQKHVHCAAFFKDKQILGYILFSLVLDEGEIFHVYVDPLHRQQKVAEMLLSYCYQQCFAADIKMLFLEVSVDNKPALNLYKKHGFEDVGLRKAYYSDKNTDARVMKKILKQGQS